MSELFLRLAATERRHAELIELCRAGSAGDAQREELRTAEADINRANEICQQRKIMNLMTLGYRWDDVLTHPAAPHMTARVRTGMLVEIRLEGEARTMELMEATGHVARAASMGVAIGDWIGTAGRLGKLADLGPSHYKRAISAHKNTSSAAKAKPAAPEASMGDLFA